MKIKLALATLALAATPGLALAMCAGEAHVTASASPCQASQVWDAGTSKCVTKPGV